MNRPQRIAAAVMATGDYQSKTAAALSAEISLQTERPYRHVWTYAELKDRFGQAAVEAIVAKSPVIALHVARGIDLSDAEVRARLSDGGDMRLLTEDANADALLALGVTVSSPWQDAGNEDDPPTTEECQTALSGTVNQTINRQRLADRYNAAVALIDSDPAATWESITDLLME